MARSTNFWDRCGKRWQVIRGELLCLAGIILIHDPDLLGDSMHLMMEALKIWSLDGVCHRMSLVI